MKTAVLTDVHANLPALEAVLNEVERKGVDRLIHLGDVVGIGPYPAECLDRLLSLENARFVMGNHDEWMAFGLPQPQPAWMSNGEVEHQRWTHRQVESGPKRVVAEWPFVLQEEIEGVSAVFLHYALEPSGVGFSPIIPDPTTDELDMLFGFDGADLICFGHTHRQLDKQGAARYINPGALGCHDRPVARYAVIECEHGRAEIQHRAVGYDIDRLYAVFEDREVPERAFIYQAFFGGMMP